MTTKVAFKPLGNRVVIEPSEGEEQVSAGGIYIPDTAKEKPQEGEVVAVGDGKVLDSGTKVKMSVKTGDRILFGKYAGTEVTIENVEYIIMREDEVLGIM